LKAPAMSCWERRQKKICQPESCRRSRNLQSQRIRDPESSSTIDDMLEIAYQAGFSAKSARFFHSITGLNKQMPTMTALLRKS
jgi:hypothetical protein